MGGTGGRRNRSVFHVHPNSAAFAAWSTPESGSLT
jgi:hypothetical protein